MQETLNTAQYLRGKFHNDVINSGLTVKDVASFQIIRHGNQTKIKMILVTGTKLILPTEYELTDELMDMVADTNSQLNIVKLQALLKPMPIF